MKRFFSLTILAAMTFVCLAHVDAKEESKSAQTTRKTLKTKITISIKEQGTKAFLDEMNLELDKPLRFKIDNASGVSNNTKISFKGKDVTVEHVLNEICDKQDWGWIVISNAANNREDGFVVIRKSSKGKERGYEAGKEPKK